MHPFVLCTASRSADRRWEASVKAWNVGDGPQWTKCCFDKTSKKKKKEEEKNKNVGGGEEFEARKKGIGSIDNGDWFVSRSFITIFLSLNSSKSSSLHLHALPLPPRHQTYTYKPFLPLLSEYIHLRSSLSQSFTLSLSLSLSLSHIFNIYYIYI